MKWDIVRICLALSTIPHVVPQNMRLGGGRWSQEGKKDSGEKQETVEFWSRFLQEPSSVTPLPTKAPIVTAQPTPMTPPSTQPSQSPTQAPHPTQAPTASDPCANVTCKNPIEGCDPFDGLCKVIDSIVPCIAVIDESSNYSDDEIDELWETFRAQYPFRPFCLLRPLPGEFPIDRLYIPLNFTNDRRTTFANVSRDNLGELSYIPGPSDWFSICGFEIYSGRDIEFIGKFVDESGSMYLSTVAESNALFLEKVSNANLTVKEVRNTLENWIAPFLTSLVPSA